MSRGGPNDAALDNPCPTCGVAPGESCRGEDYRIFLPHGARYGRDAR